MVVSHTFYEGLVWEMELHFVFCNILGVWDNHDIEPDIIRLVFLPSSGTENDVYCIPA